ncbi:P-loop NTPase, partial [Myxococcota bacterium]|nr:P-loop NTPase [Myxococcota bacterium]
MSPSVWSFGGGKGGVGKSLICASVAIELAKRGQRVLAVDADLGAANLHTLLGVARPARTLGDFFAAEAEAGLMPFTVETEIEGLRLLSGAASILEDAHPRPAEKRRLAARLLALDVDAVLIDLGAGAHYNTIDFFNFSGRGLVVTGPEPTSIQNAYAFLKSSVFRAFEQLLPQERWIERLLSRAIKPTEVGRVDSVDRLLAAFEAQSPEVASAARVLLAACPARLVLNQATPKEERKILAAVELVCRRYLSLSPPHLSSVPIEPDIARAIRRMRPVSSPPGTHFHYNIQRLLDALLADPGSPRLEIFPEPLAPPAPPAPQVEGDELSRMKAALEAMRAGAPKVGPEPEPDEPFEAPDEPFEAPDEPFDEPDEPFEQPDEPLDEPDEPLDEPDEPLDEP